MRNGNGGLPTDEELMAQVADNETDAFEEIYDRYCARAYRLARTVCREPALAEEAVQDGFLSVWRSRSTYSSERGTVAAWLLTTVRYRAIDTARRNGTHAHRQTSDEALENRPAPILDAADQTIRAEEADQLRDLLAQIPESQREVITLAFFGELSHTQIATQLDLPMGTVKGRMRLGLEKLRLRLDVERGLAPISERPPPAEPP